jgi:hypothetical protein
VYTLKIYQKVGEVVLVKSIFFYFTKYTLLDSTHHTIIRDCYRQRQPFSLLSTIIYVMLSNFVEDKIKTLLQPHVMDNSSIGLLFTNDN